MCRLPNIALEMLVVCRREFVNAFLSFYTAHVRLQLNELQLIALSQCVRCLACVNAACRFCLLYTSDAADE